MQPEQSTTIDDPFADDCAACLGTGYFPLGEGRRKTCETCGGTGRRQPMQATTDLDIPRFLRRAPMPAHRLTCHVCDHVWIVEGHVLAMKCPACPVDRYAQRISVEPSDA